MKNSLALIRQKLGHGKVKSFIQEELGVRYRTFVHQAEHGTMPYKTIRLLMNKLGLTFDQFKDYAFTDNHEQQSKAKKQQVRKAKKTTNDIEKAIDELNVARPQKLSDMFRKKT